MSGLWITFSVLMLATFAAVCLPFVRRLRQRSGSESSVYIAQIKEIDREESLGLLPADDAGQARLEIKRRLAATLETKEFEENEHMRRSDQVTLVAAAAAIAIGSALIYMNVGAPQIPSANRSRQVTASMPSDQAAGPAATDGGVGSVDDMIASLEARLEASPEDVEGWRMLGWSRFRTGDVEGARQAYQKAVDLAPDDAQTLSALGEAQARVAGGFVNDAAVANLQKAVSLDPGDPRARFLLGLRKEQDGDAKGALDDWIALIGTAEPGAEWQDEVRTRILELSQQSGIDVTGRIPDAVLQAVGGPSPQAIVEAEEMSAQERADMIEGMVTRLDQKLRADPENLEGWMRLIRARRVLNQEDLAADALKRARSVFAADAVALMQLDDAATGAMDTPAD